MPPITGPPGPPGGQKKFWEISGIYLCPTHPIGPKKLGRMTSFGQIKSDWKRMSLFKWPCYHNFWPFFAICMFIFHRTEVQTVILRCLTDLNLNWFKSYGLRCNLRPRASSVNSQKITTDKWPFYDQIWPFFCQPNGYLSQNWDSDSHFGVLNESKS